MLAVRCGLPATGAETWFVHQTAKATSGTPASVYISMAQIAEPESSPNRMSRRAKRHSTTRRKTPLWAKIVLVLGSLALIVTGAGLISVPLLTSQLERAIPTQDLLGSEVVPGASIDGAITMLLVGVDTRPGDAIGTRADSIMIAHIPASHDRVYLLSLPRDTNALIPPFAKADFDGGNYKINSAFYFGSRNKRGYAGGFELLALTIKKNYGITFNGGAIINFDGFTDIVTKLGGVDMYVDELTTSIHHGYINGDRSQHATPYNINPNTGVPRCPHGYTFDRSPLKCALPGVTPVQYQKGFQHLSAYDALDYVRCRDGLVGTDYARQRHQQQFVKALLKKAYDQGMSDPFKLKSFLTAIAKAFIFDKGGAPLDDWIFTLKNINPSSLVTIKTNNGQYVRYTGPAPDSRQALDEASTALLSAVRNDTVGEFVAAHPTWVAKS